MTQSTDDLVERCLHARVPGGAEVWCFLPQKDAFTPSETARAVIRAAIEASGLTQLTEHNRMLEEALRPFAQVADAFDYWCAEAMPEFTYPVQTCDTKFALEDCPNAIGELTESDFARARTALTRSKPDNE